MIIAYHAIFTCYGFWLPNDPRGSWSEFVRSYELYTFGGPTKTNTRRSVAHRIHDAAKRRDAKRALKYPPVKLTGVQARCAGRAFGEQAHKSGYTIHACCVMPDHVHLVVARHGYHVEQVVNLLKGAATRRLRAEGMAPLDGHSPWAQGLWKVFLDKPIDVRRAIDYVNDNPVRAGLRRQRWLFVVPYES